MCYILTIFCSFLYLKTDTKKSKTSSPKKYMNINKKIDKSYQNFSEEIAPYRFNGNPMKYGNYPGPYEQPIQAPKFNGGYKSPTLMASNRM
jgi:hypothetical protein